jgi:hypothetical protein
VRVGGVEKRELLQGLRAHKIQLNRAAEMLFEDRRLVFARGRRGQPNALVA